MGPPHKVPLCKDSAAVTAEVTDLEAPQPPALGGQGYLLSTGLVEYNIIVGELTSM